MIYKRDALPLSQRGLRLSGTLLRAQRKVLSQRGLRLSGTLLRAQRKVLSQRGEGPTAIRTQVTRVRVLSNNHYTIGPSLWSGVRILPNKRIPRLVYCRSPQQRWRGPRCHLLHIHHTQPIRQLPESRRRRPDHKSPFALETRNHLRIESPHPKQRQQPLKPSPHRTTRPHRPTVRCDAPIQLQMRMNV